MKYSRLCYSIILRFCGVIRNVKEDSVHINHFRTDCHSWNLSNVNKDHYSKYNRLFYLRLKNYAGSTGKKEYL